MRVAIEPTRSYRLVNHGPVTLITTRSGGKPNVMAASWVMPVDTDPPRVALVIGSDSLTFENVMATGELVVNLPTVDMIEQVHEAGNLSGREVDKLQRLGLRTVDGSRVAAPLIESCIGWLECKLIRDDSMQKEHGVLVAEVVAAWADDEVFRDGKWAFGSTQKRTFHHVSGSTFLATGERLEAGTKAPRR
ncbi:MAG TPA: flavin reductase family protein [Polyangiaceae bacterium]|nr:flavin reductase family protein [Polyangiaceae bacterium]